MSKELLQQISKLKCENRKLQENYDRVSLLNIQFESDIETNISVPNKPYAWSFKYVDQCSGETIEGMAPLLPDAVYCVDIVPLYTMPVRVPLTDGQIIGIIITVDVIGMVAFARKIEEAHEIRWNRDKN